MSNAKWRRWPGHYGPLREAWLSGPEIQPERSSFLGVCCPRPQRLSELLLLSEFLCFLIVSCAGGSQPSPAPVSVPSQPRGTGWGEKRNRSEHSQVDFSPICTVQVTSLTVAQGFMTFSGLGIPSGNK